MTTPQTLHSAALRIPILHILRAAGFHSTKPSVLETLVNLTERYLLLLASGTVEHALANHKSLIPDITDVRMALTDAGVLLPVLGGAEEEWTEKLRKPLEDYDLIPYGAVRREKEVAKRDEEDTADVRAFQDWITGDKYREIRRIAGMLPDNSTSVAGQGRLAGEGGGAQEDFLTALKRKNKAIVDEEKWAGTVLGRDSEDRDLTIEGGNAGSVNEWGSKMMDRLEKERRTTGTMDVEMGSTSG
ncbi:2-methylisocitrate lyase, mitochondrial [Sphaceloma murrayae]|uniref:2-methylisocitrate lyase, mitochondrial n=1 Tax=Sphaceloma murrayae TaxID=2082308 RepID=A0A2K1QU75_9PEZI|nr:2-methylisocitrate lyase, mitochondrial [Sphaceloma murrayae]